MFPKVYNGYIMKFTCTERVLYADTDAMGITWHGNYIRWFEKGRTEYLRDIGYPYDEMERLGIMMPVRSVHCDYKSPSRFDDMLEIETSVKKLGGASVVMQYEIRRKSDGEKIVTGESTHAFTDTDLKPVRIRERFPAFYEKVFSTL
jgi:acyl-CoA thioester hydrolase